MVWGRKRQKECPDHLFCRRRTFSSGAAGVPVRSYGAGNIWPRSHQQHREEAEASIEEGRRLRSRGHPDWRAQVDWQRSSGVPSRTPVLGDRKTDVDFRLQSLLLSGILWCYVPWRAEPRRTTREFCQGGVIRVTPFGKKDYGKKPAAFPNKPWPSLSAQLRWVNSLDMILE